MDIGEAEGGCAGCLGLEAGSSYGVMQELSDEWEPLKPISHTFETAVSGAGYQYTFINTQQSDWFVYLPLVIK